MRYEIFRTTIFSRHIENKIDSAASIFFFDVEGWGVKTLKLQVF